MKKPKILVLGHGAHGKGTFCHMLCKLFQLKSLSSSRAALPYIFPTLKNFLGYENEEEAFNDRRNHRILWRDLIALYNTPDKTTLTREITKQAHIYDGMRDYAEYTASRNLFDLIFWVEANQRLDGQTDPSMEIIFNPKNMYLISNNGSKGDLFSVVNSPGFAELLGVTKSACKKIQYSDQIQCAECGLAWDVNDPEPPVCPATVPNDPVNGERLRRAHQRTIDNLQKHGILSSDST